MKKVYNKSNKNLLNNNFNWILTFIFGFGYLIFPNFSDEVFKYLLWIILFTDLFYFLVYLMPKKFRIKQDVEVK